MEALRELNRSIQSHIRDLDPIEHARSELELVRARAREHQHGFSLETQRQWRELEQSIEDKLDDLGARMVESSQTADDAAVARIRELTQAVEQLLERHVSCPAAAIMRPAVACAPGDSLEHAANLLWDNDCGALPVVDGAGKVLAMITDRDICMALYIQGRPAKECSVESAMSKHCYTCSSDEWIQGLVELMSRYQVRRLPVVNAAGKLEGIVSLADVARYLDRLSPGHPTRELLVPTLAAVSHPRCGPGAA